MIAQKVRRCERRRQPAGVPDLQTIIVEAYLDGCGAQVLPVADRINNRFSHGIQRILPDNLPLRPAGNLETGLKPLTISSWLIR